MKLVTALAITLTATLVSAQQFQLRSTNGDLSKPLQLREGASVKLGTNEISIVNIKTDSDVVIDTMNKIRIPKINFRQASIRYVVVFLHDAAMEFDKHHKGINIILKPQALGESGDTCPDPWSTNPPPDTVNNEYTNLITFSAIDITFKEALDIIVDIANLKYMVRNGIVTIMPKNAPEGPIVHRIYPVLAAPIQRIKDCARSSMAQKNQEDGDEINSEIFDRDTELKTFFANFGVEWPEGSSIKYEPGLGKLIVANTVENLRTFEDVLHKLNVIPYQVKIDLQFVSFELSEIAKLAPDISQEKLTALWRKGGGKLLGAPTVTTQTGQQATIKGVTEYIYPTGFSVAGGSETNTAPATPVAEPESFETREVGAILDVLPEVSPDGEMINVTLSPELTKPPIWEEYGMPYTDANGKTQQLHMPQPFFHTHSIQTSILLKDGDTIMIGGGSPSGDGQYLVYMFLTATRIGIDGKKLRKNDGDSVL